MEIAIILCVTLGLRRGEAVGLSWGDVDFVNMNQQRVAMDAMQSVFG